jgi:hypothetical protein
MSRATNEYCNVHCGMKTRGLLQLSVCACDCAEVPVVYLERRFFDVIEVLTAAVFPETRSYVATTSPGIRFS